MSAKVKELKASLKERNKVVEELERRLTEQNVALEASKSQASETEQSAARLQMKVTEMKQIVAERDDQLQTFRDELTAVCLCCLLTFSLSVSIPFVAKQAQPECM